MATRRLTLDGARVCDGFLDFALVAFAGWTVAYHLCLLLGVGTAWAAGLAALALVPAAWLALGGRAPAEESPSLPPAPAGGGGRPRLLAFLAALNAVAALAAGALFAFTNAYWRNVWLLWALAAGAAVLLTFLRPAPPPGEESRSRATSLSALVPLAWAAGFAVFSLFLVRSADDDVYYVRLSSWIAANGRFPLRDVQFSDEAFPAIIYPPLSSFEALAGTVARGLGVSAPDVVYLALAPAVAALGVLAVWRLLRAWEVPLTGLALSTSMVFVLMTFEMHRGLGNMILSRSWHGKVVLLALLVPLLYALLHDYADRPTPRGLALLAAAGTAGVGLTTSAVFIVPVVAAGCLAPLALRAPRRAALGAAATLAYPLAAGVATLVAGGHAAVKNLPEPPAALVEGVLGTGVVALISVAAFLVGPVLVRRVSGAVGAAGVALIVTCLLTPQAIQAVYDLTGLGRVLWRLLWAVPLVALVGVLAGELGARLSPRALRAAPALALCGALLAWGTFPLERGGIDLASSPSWKRFPNSVADAKHVLGQARPGEVVVAPLNASKTILVVSGTVTPVASRPFYATSLGRDNPGAHEDERLLLLAFADSGLGRPEGPLRRHVDDVGEADVARALRVLDVDLACLAAPGPEERRVLADAGWVRAEDSERLACYRPAAGT